MYNVQLDESNFYTGNYATFGFVANGVNVEKLPPSENQLCYFLADKTEYVKAQYPVKTRAKYVTEITETKYLDSVEISEEDYDLLSDDEKENVSTVSTSMEKVVYVTDEEYDNMTTEEQSEVFICYVTDDEGNVVYEEKEEPITVKKWVYSESKYKELQTAEEGRENSKEKTDSEKISDLTKEVERLQSNNDSLSDQVTTLTDCLIEMSEIIYA